MVEGLEESLRAALDSYSATLATVGSCAVQVNPEEGNALLEKLRGLQGRLQAETPAAELKHTGEAAQKAIREWGKETTEYLKQTAREVKDIMTILEDSAHGIRERDHKHTGQLQSFAGRLKAISGLNDMASVHKSLIGCASELGSYVDRMTKESDDVIAKLQADLSVHRVRLAEAERIAFVDPTTGLENKVAVSRAIEFRVAQKQVFSLVLLDLDGFKKISSEYGQLAGDNLLKQFGEELKSYFGSTDLVSRWDGDAFLVVLDSTLENAVGRAAGLKKWVFGEYDIASGSKSRKVGLSAAVGVVTWKPGETAANVLKRAEEAVRQQRSRPSALPGYFKK